MAKTAIAAASVNKLNNRENAMALQIYFIFKNVSPDGEFCTFWHLINQLIRICDFYISLLQFQLTFAG